MWSLGVLLYNADEIMAVFSGFQGSARVMRARAKTQRGSHAAFVAL